MVKTLAVTGLGVVAGSFAVGPILGAVGIKQEDGFGLDDVLAALIVAGAIMALHRVVKV